MRALWHYRSFIYEGAVYDLRHRYAGSSLGVFWNVLTPLAMLVLYALVFTVFIPTGSLRSGSGGAAFVVYLASGFLPWVAFVESLIRGAHSLVVNAAYLKKMPIPEQVFVAESALSGLMAMGISLVLVMALAVVVRVPLHPVWLLLPAIMVLWQVMGFGLALLLATLNVFFRDIGAALGVLFQIWMWSLPIVYLEEFLPLAYRSLLAFNPGYPFVAALRAVLLDQRIPDPWLWLAMALWAALATAFGFFALKRLQPEIRDVL